MAEVSLLLLYGATYLCCPDLSVERVAALAQENSLPVPVLDLDSLASSTSGFGQYESPPIHAPVPVRGYSSEDPWSVSKLSNAASTNGVGSINNGAPSSIAGTGLPKEWWKKQDAIHVNILGQQGFLLNRYLVYEVSTDVRTLATSFIPSNCIPEGCVCSPKIFGICVLVGLPGEAISIPSSPIPSAQTHRT